MISGVIVSNLSEAMQNQGLSVLLSHELSSIYQWSIDFGNFKRGSIQDGI